MNCSRCQGPILSALGVCFECRSVDEILASCVPPATAAETTPGHPVSGGVAESVTGVAR